MMIHIKYHEKEFLALQADCQAFSEVKEWITQTLDELHAPARETKKILVSADEIFTNIASYGYPETAENKPLEISIFWDDETKTVFIRFKDYGVPFNPLTAGTEKTAKERVKQRLVGGLGLFLVQQFMDGLQYDRDGECNIMTISKCIDSSNENHES